MTSENLLSWRRLTINVLALCLCGFSIGWLVGLSTSPVIAKVLESVLGIAGAAVATLAGVQVASKSEPVSSDAPPETKPGTKVTIDINAAPIAMFSLFLAIGASVGLAARVRDWFSPNPEHFVAEWSSSTKARPEVLAKVLLGSEYPDFPNVELRDQLLPSVVKQASSAASSDVSREIEVMYPHKQSTSEASTHPSANTGLKADVRKPGGCTEIANEKKSDPVAFNLAAQVSNKFATEFATCHHGEEDAAVCALRIWSAKCI